MHSCGTMHAPMTAYSDLLLIQKSLEELSTGNSLIRDKRVRDRAALEAIPGVEKFEQLRQVSKKNDYAFGFSMEFADQAAYDGYNAHPRHVKFVRDRWEREVSKFLEIDYELL